MKSLSCQGTQGAQAKNWKKVHSDNSKRNNTEEEQNVIETSTSREARKEAQAVVRSLAWEKEVCLVGQIVQEGCNPHNSEKGHARNLIAYLIEHRITSSVYPNISKIDAQACVLAYII